MAYTASFYSAQPQPGVKAITLLVLVVASAFHDRLALCDKKARLTNWTRHWPPAETKSVDPGSDLSSICSVISLPGRDLAGPERQSISFTGVRASVIPVKVLQLQL